MLCTESTSLVDIRTSKINNQGVLCKGYQLRPNGDKLFQDEKFMHPMGRPKTYQPIKVPCFFAMRSHYVPSKFSMGSHQVPHMFPQHILHSTSLLSHMFWQMLSSIHLHRWVKGEELYTSKQNLLFWGTSLVFFFFE